ncbi:sulfatase-like hydrolase/transferase, partial [Glaesserella parasuis]
ARKDYHHAYGYPAENTPFMSSANGILIDGLTAGGTNTIASLKLMLTKPDTQKWEGEYSLGMVDLIKSAGIKTYWLSNQGYLGTFDTPVSSLANKSDEKLFLKSGDSFHQNISDFDLLPKFEHIIEQKTHSKRFVVVHLYGSHPISCDRLTD